MKPSRDNFHFRYRAHIVNTGAESLSSKQRLVVHVAGGVDAVLWELGDLGCEALFNGLENSLVVGAADKRDTQTLGTETTGTTDTMQVSISLVGHVVVDGNVDALDIDTTTEDVGRDTDTSLELLELLVTLDTVEIVSTY
jgi:hypothetical protein